MNMFGKMSIMVGAIVIMAGITAYGIQSRTDARADVIGRNNPIELEDGRLIFSGMSDIEVQRFSAEQFFQLNRRLSSVQAMMIRMMSRDPFLASDAASFMDALVQQDRVLLRSVVPSAPEAKN